MTMFFGVEKYLRCGTIDFIEESTIDLCNIPSTVSNLLYV